jgi:predicted AAA+ superfamily ATPase
MKVFKRQAFQTFLGRLKEPRRFIQVLGGPRQTGKTTIALQIMDGFPGSVHYASGDEPTLKDRAWIEEQWEVARLRARGAGRQPSLLILDEIQKIPGWSETVKYLWDADTSSRLGVRTVLLGSSPLLVQGGLTESLAGRFEIIHVPHWSFAEMREAFKWDLDKFIFYGGYPGAAPLIQDYERWSRYILDSLIETSISRDVLLMTRVDKPALLRRLFELGCVYSGQVLSYQKMLGQLHDAGNTTTLAHYLRLLQGAGLIAGVQKYHGQVVRQRASSPKLLALNAALMTASSRMTLSEAKNDTQFWGRLVESVVGASLFNGIQGKNIELLYWAAGNQEVDYVLSRGKTLVALEVKSGRRGRGLPGMAAFSDKFKVKRKLLVGASGIPLEEFLLTPAEVWLE